MCFPADQAKKLPVPIKEDFPRIFYSIPSIAHRVWNNILGHRQILISLVGNLSYRKNFQLNRKAFVDLKRHYDSKKVNQKKYHLAL